MLEQRSKLLVVVILLIDALLLLLQISQLSISYHEADIYFNHSSYLYYPLHVVTHLFGQNDYALRLPFIIIHTLSVLLFYLNSNKYLKYERDRIILLVIFLLIPGVLSASLIVDESAVVIFLLLLFEYIRQKNEKYSYLLLFFYSFISAAFVYIYLGIIFFASENRNVKLFLFSLANLVINVYIFKVDDGGIPQGHFLDALGLYAVILSPIVFMYIVYVLYRKYLQDERDILWYIISTSLLLNLLFSFRQTIHVEMYAPYLLLALGFSAKMFFHSYRVRLPRFRKKYKQLFNVSLAFLLLNALSVFFHKELYLFLDEPSHHFAYRMHVAKELSSQLKTQNIECIDANDTKLQLRLKFYGVEMCKKNQLLKYKKEDNSLHVTIRHRDNLIYDAYVSKSYKL